MIKELCTVYLYANEIPLKDLILWKTEMYLNLNKYSPALCNNQLKPVL